MRADGHSWFRSMELDQCSSRVSPCSSAGTTKCQVERGVRNSDIAIAFANDQVRDRRQSAIGGTESRLIVGTMDSPPDKNLK